MVCWERKNKNVKRKKLKNEEIKNEELTDEQVNEAVGGETIETGSSIDSYKCYVCGKNFDCIPPYYIEGRPFCINCYLDYKIDLRHEREHIR